MTATTTTVPPRTTSSGTTTRPSGSTSGRTDDRPRRAPRRPRAGERGRAAATARCTASTPALPTSAQLLGADERWGDTGRGGTVPQQRPEGRAAAGGGCSSPARGERTPAAGSRRLRGDVGMATAEYAIATLAACGFAGLLLAILASGEVRGLLLGIIQRALSLG